MSRPTRNLLGEPLCSTLRFKVGDRLLCNTGHWEPATVVKLRYREDDFDEGCVAPYQLQLDRGGCTYAPADDMRCILPLHSAAVQVSISDVLREHGLHNVDEAPTGETLRVAFLGGTPPAVDDDDDDDWEDTFERRHQDVQAALEADSVARLKVLAQHYGEDDVIDGDQESLIQDAARSGAMKVVAWMVQRHGKCKLDPREGECTHCMPYAGRSGCPSERGYEGDSPLHHAAESGNVGMLRMLLDLGGNVDHMNKWGNSPLSAMLSHVSRKGAPSLHVAHEELHHDDCFLACMCLLLHRKASTYTAYCPTQGGRGPPIADTVSELPGLPPALAAYLADPPRDYPGISRRRPVKLRRALVLAWAVAKKREDAAGGLASLPLELVQAIAQHLPDLGEPTQAECNALKAAAWSAFKSAVAVAE